MRNYMKGLTRYDVTITAGHPEYGTTTFTDEFIARNADAARDAAKRKWHGAAIGEILDSFATIRRNRACFRCGASPAHCDCPDQMDSER